ncbi:hypothetical protein BpHYR1_011047 [Brachionus plicatilis]|uniref:Uncharacterized protein n=1 Tax=Brachionus plicatilis TaxID=10195 RepID=A0A3M7PNS7_BRAPC|nr:hypothetical protein BpHYR1_011047 [Brachionus plicatilis]
MSNKLVADFDKYFLSLFLIDCNCISTGFSKLPFIMSKINYKAHLDLKPMNWFHSKFAFGFDKSHARMKYNESFNSTNFMSLSNSYLIIATSSPDCKIYPLLKFPHFLLPVLRCLVI